MLLCAIARQYLGNKTLSIQILLHGLFRTAAIHQEPYVDIQLELLALVQSQFVLEAKYYDQPAWRVDSR